MEIPAPEDGERCRRTGTPNWRCRERALPGRSYCQKHYSLSVSRQLRRKSFPEEARKGISGVHARRKSFPGAERDGFSGDSLALSDVEPYRPVIDFGFQENADWTGAEPGFGGSDGIVLNEPGFDGGGGNDGIALGEADVGFQEMVGGMGGSYYNTLGSGGEPQFNPVWTGDEPSFGLEDGVVLGRGNDGTAPGELSMSFNETVGIGVENNAFGFGGGNFGEPVFDVGNYGIVLGEPGVGIMGQLDEGDGGNDGLVLGEQGVGGVVCNDHNALVGGGGGGDGDGGGGGGGGLEGNVSGVFVNSEVASKETVNEGQKRKRGRPKGSKNKKKVVDNQVIRDDDKKCEDVGVNFGGNEDVGKRVRRLFESDSEQDDCFGGKKDEVFEDENRIEEEVDEGLRNEEVPSVTDAGIEMIMPKKKRGRPKGVKNKPKMGQNNGDGGRMSVGREGDGVTGCALEGFKGSKRRNKDVVLVAEVGGGLEKKAAKRGRPKGSKNGKRKKVIVVAKVEEEVLEKKLEKRGRHPKRLKNEEEDVSMCDAEVGKELGKKRQKLGRGRPKGSKKKKKMSERQRVYGEGPEQVSEAGSEVVQGVRNDPDHDDSKETAKGNNDNKTGVPKKKKKQGRPKGLKNKRFILVDGIPHKVISSQHGDRSLVVQKDMSLVEFSQHCGNGKVNDDAKLLHESANAQQTPQRKVSKYQLRARDVPEGASGSKRGQSSMCHQCLSSEKNDVIVCSWCKKKRYCNPCLSKWYSERTREEVQEACPFCRGNCNCKACLQEKLVMKDRQKDIDRKVKLERLMYLMCKLNPLLKRLQEEQRADLEMEAKAIGKTIKEEEVMKTRLDQDDRIYCDNCNTSIVNFHRSCPSSVCSYDLCLSCCQELRSDLTSDGTEAGSSCQSIEGLSHHGVTENSQNDDAANIVDNEVSTVSNYLPTTVCWKPNMDGSIRCPPKGCGGCGLHILELRRILEFNWVDTLVERIEKVTVDYNLPETDSSQKCPICLPTASGSQGNASETRKAASREKLHDNFLYCPSALNIDEIQIDHFQMHWTRGEPVIVRDVLRKGSGLSWEPMVMWRAFRGAKKIMKEDTLNVKAIDCLDWCEVRARLSR